MGGYKIKPYEELDITDNFMFSKVFSNEDVFRNEPVTTKACVT